MERTLVFPNQLFHQHPALKKGRPVMVIEDSLFFGDPHHPAKFHQQKLVFHRASMKAYAAHLTESGYSVEYIDYKADTTIEKVLSGISSKTRLDLYLADPTDFLLKKRLRRFEKNADAALHFSENPSFLTRRNWNDEYFGSRKQRFMATYYKEQRKRLNILVDADGQPEGGQWSFDADNRKPLPKGHNCPEEPTASASSDVDAAIHYVSQKFADHPGDASQFWYSTTRRGALQWLQGFLESRFQLFGDYEDAISENDTVLYHSVLTPYMNSGLITPDEVIRKALTHAKQNNIPLNSLEGFIRQIIGWREFMRAMYECHGVEERTGNYWKCKRHIPDAFYSATTGIPPIDQVIQRTLDRSYCHHIERLMVLGNFMLLCRIHPDDVYRWFMEMFIDAYDWVMVPNVYGMSQFADGGIFTTKPYISSSNYIRKMSNYKKGTWCDVWDGLYWSFIHQEQQFFRNHPRLGMMTRQLDKMAPEKLKIHQENAARFLQGLK
ncbi:MAG: cryptochrome/photolyase family protein [Verrucomicrobiota bacterium]